MNRSQANGNRVRCPLCQAGRSVAVFPHQESGKPVAHCFSCEGRSGDIMRGLGQHVPEPEKITGGGGSEYAKKLWDEAKGIMQTSGCEAGALHAYLHGRFATVGNMRRASFLLAKADCRLTTERIKGRPIVSLISPIRLDGRFALSVQRTFISRDHPAGDKRKTSGKPLDGYLDLAPPVPVQGVCVVAEGLEKGVAIALAGFRCRVSFGAQRLGKVARDLHHQRVLFFCDNDKVQEGEEYGISVRTARNFCGQGYLHRYWTTPPPDIADADEWLRQCEGNVTPLQKHILTTLRRSQ